MKEDKKLFYKKITDLKTKVKWIEKKCQYDKLIDKQMTSFSMFNLK